MKLKNYLAVCGVGEGMPNYDFIVKAKGLEDAFEIAGKILKADYPENWKYNKNDFSVRFTTAKELLKTMTLN